MAKVLSHVSDQTRKAISEKDYAKVSITQPDGRVRILDVNFTELPAWMREAGIVQNKRGRKSNSEKNSGVGSTAAGAVAGKVNR